MAHSSTDKDQRQRFIDAARELGCEEGFDRMDEALKRIGTTPPQTQTQTPVENRERPSRRPASGRKQKAPK